MESISREKLYAQVGVRIRKAREAQIPKVTQSGLAERLKVERTSVTNIEKGTQRATLQILYGIARELKVSLTALLPEIDDPSILTGVAEVTVGKRTQTVPTAVKSVFEKV